MKSVIAMDDYKSWDRLIAHCDTIEGFSALEREQTKRALSFLRAELGDSFLATAMETRHPFVSNVFNLAPWTRKWLKSFADELRLAKSSVGFESMRTRILDGRRYGEAVQVLHVAAAFRRQGFQITIDPQLPNEAEASVPDLLLTDGATGDRIYLEVSALNESELACGAYETSNRIHAPIWRGVPFLQFAARIHKALAPRHLEEIVTRVEQLVEVAKTDKAFAHLSIDGVLEIGISPESDKAMLEQWAATRGLTVGTLSGPPVRVDELQRIRSKIRKKQYQLPGDLPGIVVVLTNHLFPWVKEHRALIGELEEAVYDHGHLLAAVVGGSYIGGGMLPDELLMHGQHIYLRKTTCEILVEEYVVLLNQFCDHKVSASSITKLYNAFKPEPA